MDIKVFMKVLKEGWIVGVGFDVYEEELYYNEELFSLKNVVLVLYIGSVIYGVREGMVELVVRNFIVFKNGEVFLIFVNKEVVKVRKFGF